MRRKKIPNGLLTVTAILLICIIAFLWWLVYHVKALPIILIILLPSFSYYLVKKVEASNSTRIGVFIVVLFVAFTFFLQEREQVGYYSQPIVDGKWEEREISMESDDGIEYSALVQAYVPKTKKGEQAIEIIKWTLTGIVVVSVYISYRLIDYQPTRNE